jgi:hypothetical protein
MSMYTDNLLTLDGQRRSHADERRMADRDGSEDGTLIFCGISLTLMLVALCVAASGHGDISAVMF